jgi:hypothetical protein
MDGVGFGSGEHGHAAMKSGAVTATEKAIDRALTENKLRVIPLLAAQLTGMSYRRSSSSG